MFGFENKISAMMYFSQLICTYFSVGVTIPEVEAKKCQIIINPRGCDLPDCTEQCLSYKGVGSCIPNAPGSTLYVCSCAYDCWANLLLIKIKCNTLLIYWLIA